jgi:hypothetical protein
MPYVAGVLMCRPFQIMDAVGPMDIFGMVTPEYIKGADNLSA